MIQITNRVLYTMEKNEVCKNLNSELSMEIENFFIRRIAPSKSNEPTHKALT